MIVRQGNRMTNRHATNLLRYAIALFAVAGGASAGTVSDQETLSITGSGLRSITGSSLRSITGSSRRSITGSSQRSITGSSRRSITGSSQRSITGSSRRSITGSSQRNFSDVGIDGTLVAYGPIVSVSETSISILGQDLSLLEVQSEPLTNTVGLSAYVEAVVVDGEAAVTSLFIEDEYSAPGASPIFISGTVANLSLELGRIHIGDVEIDLTGAGLPAIAIGDTVAVTGTQPVAGGLVIAQSVLVLEAGPEGSSENLRSITGSSRR